MSVKLHRGPAARHGIPLLRNDGKWGLFGGGPGRGGGGGPAPIPDDIDLPDYHFAMYQAQGSDPDTDAAGMTGDYWETFNTFNAVFPPTYDNFRLQCGATALGGEFGFNSTLNYVPEHNPKMLVPIIGHADSLANMRFWVGFSSGILGSILADSDDPSSLDVAAFLYSAAGAASTWKCYTSNGSGSTTVDTGIALSATDWQNMRIEMSVDNVKFYINGSLVATMSATNPKGSTMFHVVIGLNTTTTTPKVGVKTFALKSDRQVYPNS